MGKRRENKKALKFEQAQTNKSMEEVISPTAETKETINLNEGLGIEEK